MKILLIEDNREVYDLTRRLLASQPQQYVLERAAGHEEALEAVRSQEHDVYLVDYDPGHHAPELLLEIFAQGCAAPVVVLTSQSSEQVDAAVARAGAADYLVKGELTPALLERSLRYAVERKRAQDALLQSEERRLFQNQLLDAVGQAVIATDVDGSITYWNRSAESLYGWSAEEALGQSIVSLVSPQVSQREAAAIMERLWGGDSWSGEFMVRRRDGGLFPIRITDSAIRNEAGEVVGVIGVSTDITARKQAEEALRVSEARFRAVCESSPLGIALANAHGDCIYVNPAMQGQMGTGFAEALGDGWARAVHPEDRERVVSEWLAAVRAGHTYEGTHRFVHSDGTTIKVRVIAAAVRDEDWILGYVTMAEDITQSALLQEQLLQAQKMEAIGRLAGGVAHDFNNMLAVITGYTELILTKLPREHPVFGFVMEIGKAGERAGRLTRQLLAFSRKQILMPKVVDMGEIVSGVHSLLRRLIGEDIELITVYDGTCKQVRADPGQLEQVLVNLAVNARDAMPDGGRLTLEISEAVIDEGVARIHPEVQPGRYVLLRVSDTGCGMDSGTLSHIFEPFFTTKAIGKGTGLGLAMVYGIIQQSDGYIEVASEPSLGTSFSIYLPRVEEVIQTPEAARSRSLPTGQETILVVEDEPRVRGLVQEVLQECGYTILQAAHGDEAMRICELHPGPIDLLLTDVVMPLVGGPALAEQFRLSRPECGVLFMSGYFDDKVMDPKTLDQGSGFIEKPVTPAALAQKVRQVLDEKGSPRSALAGYRRVPSAVAGATGI
jgi:PAS domain S-box-containing protein